jgi:hypothetical protein
MSNAPLELREIGLDPGRFFKSDAKSWRGPCPQCGGTRRFLMFTDNEWPLWNGQCDECGLKIKAWQKVRVSVDPHVLATREAEIAREEAEKAEKRRVKLAEFTSHNLWEELSERMVADNVEYWEKQGIPEEIQKLNKLGYTPDKIYMTDGKPYHSPAYTIPWFGFGYEFLTMQYRLTMPVNPKDKYRFESDLPGGGSFFYMSVPSEPIGDRVIICEGAKKALVTWFWLTEAHTVLGTASNNTLRPALEATKDCGERILILDPGSEKRAWVTAKENKGLKILILPEKIDDMYLKYELDRDGFQQMLRQARTV